MSGGDKGEDYRVEVKVEYSPALCVHIVFALTAERIHPATQSFQPKHCEHVPFLPQVVPIPVSSCSVAAVKEENTSAPLHVTTPSLVDEGFRLPSDRQFQSDNAKKDRITSPISLFRLEENRGDMMGTGHFRPNYSELSIKEASELDLEASASLTTHISSPDTASFSGNVVRLQPSQSSARKQPHFPPLRYPKTPQIAEIESTLRALAEGNRASKSMLRSKAANSPEFLISKKRNICRYFSPAERISSRTKITSKMQPKAAFSAEKQAFRLEMKGIPQVNSANGKNTTRSRSTAARLALLSREEGRYRVLDYTGGKKGVVLREEGKDWSKSKLDEEVRSGCYDFNKQRDVMSACEVAGALRLLTDGKELPQNAHIRTLRTYKRLRVDLQLPFEPAAIVQSTEVLLQECARLLKVRQATVSVLHYLHERETVQALCSASRADLVSKQLLGALMEWKRLYPDDIPFVYQGLFLLSEA